MDGNVDGLIGRIVKAVQQRRGVARVFRSLPKVAPKQYDNGG
jgi:hypothetical protein